MITPYGTDAEVADFISAARRRMSDCAGAHGSGAPPSGPVGEFLHKLRLAWQVFFPKQPRVLSPKEEGKKRLRMILVADRYHEEELELHTCVLLMVPLIRCWRPS